jgi:hypothetical protein
LPKRLETTHERRVASLESAPVRPSDLARCGHPAITKSVKFELVYVYVDPVDWSIQVVRGKWKV